MDNLTHSLVGWTLGQTGLKRKTRKGLAALILGASMPDVDVFFGWVAWAPLAIHRGFTHGIGGLLVMPPILAALLWLLDRWQVRRGVEFRSGLAMHFRWLVALSYLATFTHPLLDWQTSYAVQLLSPFSNLWFHNDSLFIIDVWIWLLLGTGIWLSRRRERTARGDWRRPAYAALGVLVLYVSINGVISESARTAVLAQPSYPDPDVMVLTPEPLAFWRREAIWREDGAISRGSYDPLRSPYLAELSGPVPDGMSDPIAREGMKGSRAVVAFMRWSILPMAEVERGRCSARVHYEDARFGGRPTVRLMRHSTTVPTGGKGCGRGIDAGGDSGS